MEAEVANLQAQATLHSAKAQETMADPQLKAAEIEAQMAIKQQELALRRQLSELTNDMRKGQTETQAAAKVATAAMKPSGGR